MLQFIPVIIDNKECSLPIGGIHKYKEWMFDRMHYVSADYVEVFMFGWIVRFYKGHSNWTRYIEYDTMFIAEFDENDVLQCFLCSERKLVNEHTICGDCIELANKWHRDPYYIHATSLTSICLYMSFHFSIDCSLYLYSDPNCAMMCDDCIYMHWLIASIFKSTNVLPEVVNIISMYTLSGLDCQWNYFGTSEGINKNNNDSSDTVNSDSCSSDSDLL